MTTNEVSLISKEEMAYRGYELRISGADWTAIAQELGYNDGAHARSQITALINKAKASLSMERKAEIIELELDRLDQLQLAVWPSAMTGDTKSIDSALKIMVHRAKLLQLGEEKPETTRTVIVTSSDYIERLREVSE